MLIGAVRFGHGKPSGRTKLVMLIIAEVWVLRLGIALDPPW